MGLPAIKIKVSAKAESVTVRSELLLNFALVVATGVHEWGNVVGYAAVPCAIAVALHIVCDVFAEKD